MKNLSLSLLFLIATTSGVHAQTDFLVDRTDRNYLLGLRAGLNISSLSPYNVVEEKPKAGLHFGFLFRQTTGLFNLQPELLYSGKGSRLSFNSPGFYGEASIRLHYLEMPVLAGFSPFPFLNLQLGPTLGLLIGSNIKDIRLVNQNNGNLNPLSGEINKSNFKQLDPGAAAGIEFIVERVMAGLRYNFGIPETYVEKSAGRRNYGFHGPKNRLAQLYLGIFF